MKRLLLALLLSFCLPVAMWSQEADVSDSIPQTQDTLPEIPDFSLYPSGYFFSSQIIEVQVHHDRTMDIQEYLFATFLERSHGLIRAIPQRFWTKRDVSEAQDRSDFEMRYNHVQIDNLEVSEDFSTNDQDSLLVLRIGSPNVYIEGPHAYRLSYRLTIPNDDRVDASDLFFHSVVGSGWDCLTDTVFFRVTFDDEIPAASLDSLKVFCGPEGNEDNVADQLLYFKDGHSLKGRYFGLKSHEAVTIYMPLPDGFFQKGKIPFWRTLAWIAAALTLLLALYLAYLEMRGQEPIIPVVTYKPSPELTSADVGSIVDAKVDNIDLLSLIPWLAAEGHIRMSVDAKGKTHIQRGDVPLGSVPEYVKCIYDGFFAKGETFSVDQPTSAFGEKWGKAKRLINKKYEFNLKDETHVWEIVLVTFLFGLTCCFSTVADDGYVNGALIHVLLLCEWMFYAHFLKKYWQQLSFRDGCLKGCVSLFIIHCLFWVIVSGTGMYIFAILQSQDSYLPYTVLVLLGIVVALVVPFIYRLNQLAPSRRRYLGEVLGLKEFIMTAEKDRLEMLLAQDERYFYRVLPYAMVFGLVDEWAKKFEGLTVIPVAEFNHVSSDKISSLINNNAMHHFSSRADRAYTPTPSYSGGSSYGGWSSSSSSSGGSYSSSSHSSGGGYSGGGSGGGGGGRW